MRLSLDYCVNTVDAKEEATMMPSFSSWGDETVTCMKQPSLR